MRGLVGRPSFFVALFLLGSFVGSSAFAGERVVFARHLSISPDGRLLSFSWAGDVWTVPVTGGLAQRLTIHPSHDSYPVWSRDGKHIAFSSSRRGSACVYTMTPSGGEVTRLSFGDRSERPTDWTPDGAQVVFDARKEGQLYWEPKAYTVAAAGGQPWRLMDCYANDARISPDGTKVAFTRGGSKWSRRWYRGSANHDIWVYDREAKTFSQVTDFDGTDRLPQWSADGRGLYFLSDREGPLNIWYVSLDDGKARRITRMEGDDVRDFAVAPNGRLLVFTHWDKLYLQRLPDGDPVELEVLAGSDAAFEDVDLRTYRSGADESEPSPDGEEIALVVHGELYVIKTEDDKPTRRVTERAARDRDITWSPDGKALFFVSDREGQEDIYRARSGEKPRKSLSDSLRFKIERITDDPELEYRPSISPDGKHLAFIRGRGDLIIRDLATGEERKLLEGWNLGGYSWSPDSKWIAYQREDEEYNADVWIVPADGSADAVNISQHPDYDGNPQWSADGQILSFASRRVGFDSDLYFVFLSPELNEMSSVALDEYFEEQKKAVGKRKPLKKAVASGKIVLAGEKPTTEPAAEEEPEKAAEDDKAAEEDKEAKEDDSLRAQLRAILKSLLEEPEEEKPDEAKKDDDKKKDEAEKKYEYDLETAFMRVRRVTTLPGDQSNYVLSPDGSLFAFTSGHTGSGGVYTIKWNRDGQKRIISGGAGALRWGLKGKKLYTLRGGVPNSCSASGSGSKRHNFRAKMAVSYQAEAAQKFDDGARQIGLRFYHPTLKGLDWDALTAKYRELALKTHTTTEFNEIFSMLLGELNASHQGIFGGGRSSGERESIGYLGCTFEADYDGPGLKVASVLPRMPADRAESKLVPGDIILAVNGEPVGPDAPIERALIDTVGEYTILEFTPAPDREKLLEEQPPTPNVGVPDDEPLDDPAPGDPADGIGDVDREAPDDDPADDEEKEDDAEDADEAAEDDDDEQEDPDDGTRELVIRPTSYGDFFRKSYDAWVEDNRRYVEEQSNGRIGYCHIIGMGESAFYEFERDLYAVARDKEGLIIDVRNNGGGWTADWVMAVLNVRRHAYTIGRGGEPGYPQGRLIFYAWTKPATMMCNQYSYSNAEIVSHAFKNLERGPLVGETTFGAVISTGSYSLIDGARVRMPGRGWYTLPAGIDMELKGAEPTVRVPVGPGHELAGSRPQLDAAIRATLEGIEADRDNPYRIPEEVEQP